MKYKGGKRPTLLVFAGPNGSGKSTISDCVKTKGMYINADEIKQLNKNLTDLEAAVEAESLREYYLREGLDFTFETVLSTNRNIDLIARAKAAGYYIDCYFVLTAYPELNEFRIRMRVNNGGHDVPADKIRSRYQKSLQNIPVLIELCDKIRIVDNTEKPFVIYINDAEGRSAISENKYWSKERITALIKRKT